VIRSLAHRLALVTMATATTVSFVFISAPQFNVEVIVVMGHS
jgi:hypothetical protein